MRNMSKLFQPVNQGLFDDNGNSFLWAHIGLVQGWEFAHLISERIARFLPKNERMSDSLKN